MDILSLLLSQTVSLDQDRQSDFDRIYWFTQIMKWIQNPQNQTEKTSRKETIYTVRLKYLVFLLKNNPHWQIHFTTQISMLLFKISSPSQLVTAGLPETSSFIQDFILRVQEKILPNPPLSDDLSTLISEIFSTSTEDLYVDSIDLEVLQELFKMFSDKKNLFKRLQMDVCSASYILSVQILNDSIIIQKELQCLCSDLHELNEFKLEGQLRELQTQPTKISDEIFIQIKAVEQHMADLYQLMKTTGVKIQVVYLFQIQKRKLTRLRILLQFLSAEIETAHNFKNFISQLILEVSHQKSLKSFFSENLNLLTERIVEANSDIGEHYVTFTWVQFKKMFYASLGGGSITALTVLIKHLISELNLVGFMKGLADSLNYSSSFLVIQLLGWTLATKQPSATAPFIAQALQKSPLDSEKSIIALLRTQFIAVIGNLSLVFPLCFLVAWVLLKFNHPLISMPEAVKLFSSSNLLGPSALYAAYTGFLLFLASLFAGWFENWFRTYRIDKRIKYNDKLQKYFGQKNIHRFAEFVLHKANPLAANLGLGFLLGMTPQLIHFVGLPIEVKHVTLATGAFATSLPTILENGGLSYFQVFNAVSGLFVIGLVNISVSFLLAFLLASASLKVQFSAFWNLLKWGLLLILTRPWLLVIPEKENR